MLAHVGISFKLRAGTESNPVNQSKYYEYVVLRTF